MPLCFPFLLIPLWAPLLPQYPQSASIASRQVPLRSSQRDLPNADAGRGGSCKAAGHQLTFSFESSPALVTLPVPLLAPLFWAPALKGADAAGHWLPLLRNHGSGGSVPASGAGRSGFFASGVSGSQARLMLLVFFRGQFVEGDGGLGLKKHLSQRQTPEWVLEARGLLQGGCEGRGYQAAMPYLCLHLSHRCHRPVACVSSLLSPSFCPAEVRHHLPPLFQPQGAARRVIAKLKCCVSSSHSPPPLPTPAE